MKEDMKSLPGEATNSCPFVFIGPGKTGQATDRREYEKYR